jgi:SAM-dependent methyltransferase
MAATGYLLQAGEDPGPERHRLRLLERFRDPGSMRRLRALGVAAGWRCLEVGAGAGSIAAWLGRVVGPSGWVVTTDIDTRHLETLRAANVEVRAADLLGRPGDLGTFDMVHGRALLHHLPGYQNQAIARLVAALRPGGWLLLEEPHVLGAAELQPGPLGQALAAWAWLSRADYTWARNLPSLLVTHGLVAVDTEASSTCSPVPPPSLTSTA